MIGYLLVFLIYIPTILFGAIGWWVGRRFAFQTLTWRVAVRAVLAVLVFSALVWLWAKYPDMRSGAVSLSDVAFGYFGVALESLGIAGLAAAIGWAVNLDDFWAARRKRNEAKKVEALRND